MMHVFACTTGCGIDARAAWKAFRSVRVIGEPAVERAQVLDGLDEDWGAGDGAGGDADNWDAGNDSWGGGDEWTVPTATNCSSLQPISADDSATPAIAVAGDVRGRSIAAQGSSTRSASHASSTAARVWPCFDIEVWPEPWDDHYAGDHEQALLEAYRQQQAAEADEPDEVIAAEDLRGEGVVEDEEDIESRYLRKFQQRIARSPQQVIRYGFGGKPLWIRPPPTTVESTEAPEACPGCGSKRVFEMQILPTLLSEVQRRCPQVVHMEEQLGRDLDFGTVAIFTCAEDCDVDEAAEEFIVVQQGF